MFMFIANYHAMTSSQDGKKLEQNSLKAAAAFFKSWYRSAKKCFLVAKRCKRSNGALLDFISIYSYGFIRARS